MTRPVIQPVVVQVLWRLERGGAERMVLDLARGLRQENFHVRIVAAGGGGALQAEIEAEDIPLALGPETSDRFKTFRFLDRFLRDHPPAIWQTHLGGDVWGGLAALWRGFHPWIATMHGSESLHPAWRRGLRSLLLPRADRVVCVSPEVRRDVMRRYHLADERTLVIPLGIDLDMFAPAVGRRAFHDIPRFITVGRLEPEKHQALLLNALAPIRRPWQLTLVGGGSEERALRRLAHDLGILPRVHFAGSVEPRQVARLLADADLFCLPSLQEGQSLAILEAAASGLPVIANDLPVFRPWFPGASATLVAEPSIAAWTRALASLLAHPAAALSRAEEATRLVRTRANVETMVRAYANLYRSLSYAHSPRQ